MIGENLLRFDRKQKYLLWDCESVSLALNSPNNIPWEYGWRLMTLDNILEEKECQLKWPKLGTGEIKVGAVVDRLTGFYKKFENYENWSDPTAVLDEFEEHLYNPEIIPIAHNGLGFDVYLHNTHRKVLGRPSDYSYIPRFIDTYAAAKGWKLQYNWEGKNRIAAQYQLLDHRVRGMKASIKALCKEFEFEYDETKAHSATYDVSRMDLIFRKLINLTEI
jgi:hypothetical protein